MILLLIAVLLLATAVYFVLHQLKVGNEVSERVHLPSNAFEESGAIESVQEEEAQLGASKKSWMPITNKFKNYEKRLPTQHLIKRLLKAGSPMGTLEFLIFKLLSLSAVPAISLIFLSNIFPNQSVTLMVSLVIGYFLPELWLNNRIKKRQNNIRKELPSIIDLLNLCVSGGMDFMLAVSRVIKDLKPSDLTIELGEVYHQTQMGKARKEALKNFALRIDSAEVHSFVRTLIQADRMGTPMAEALKLQSEELRVRRFQRGEAMALKAPIKLLIPLFLFILPVVLILVAGPILLEFTRTGIGF